MPYIMSKGQPIYYQLTGSGPPLIFIHGVGGNHASWFNQVMHFRGKYTVIAVDLAGFGNTEDRRGLGRERFVDDLSAIIYQLTEEPVHLVGQSMGGGVVLKYAERNPKKVRSMAIVNSLVGIDLSEYNEIKKMLAESHEICDGLPQHQRVLGETTLATRPEIKFLYKSISSFNKYNINNIVGQQSVMSVSEIDSLGIPILFVAAREDRLFPSECVAAVANIFNESKFKVVENAGHSSYLEKPENFNSIIEEWLALN